MRGYLLTDIPYKEYIPPVMGKLKDEIRQVKPFDSLEDEVSMNLLRTADAVLTKTTEFLKGYGLTPQQYNVLRILRGAGQTGRICREIGERMITRDPNITKLLDRLEARGWVTRERQQDDRRVIVVRISEEGNKLLDEIDEPLKEHTIGLLSHLGGRKLKTLKRLLEAAREKPL